MGSPIIIRLIVTTYFMILMIIHWIIAWILQVILMAVTYPFVSREVQQDWCGYIFHAANFFSADFLNPFWKHHILKPFPEVKDKKLIVMMNHLSNADPFLLVRVLFPRDASWVAKDELFRVPFGGWCMGNADDLKVHFKNKKAGFDTIKGTVGVMMEEARKKLRRGRPIAIFPEGIRNKNPEGGLLPFRLGFFTLAVEEGATVVPVAISGTQDCWPRGSPLLDKADTYFSCGEPIDASMFKTAEDLRDYVWQRLTEIRESHPDRQGAKKQQ
ncbi:1-acyl-sn-glycerol-3-phosphate acyltransferase [Trypanosoma grayi]|uniref:1-acyl-sn-glycerol-3-phosphate acyltransferase n=1 Tax=Trypanosoma grayi TaxID=71804 RepID=UPI0004F409F3|nr:1-acyl-sn-glycerol-3-phosphate acyltransferase [Trypanosoma grayi]KEG14846.1 1-acyl-sn-glycerol-3-phosphate acyltransferase [Trypanosoma grayi]